MRNFEIDKIGVAEIVITVWLAVLSGIFPVMIKVLSIWLLVVCLEKLVRTKDSMLFIIELFILLYSLSPLVYFVCGYYICPYQFTDGDQYANMMAVTQIQALFVTIFLACLPIKKQLDFDKAVTRKSYDVAWYLTLAMMLVCFLLIDWRSIISTLLSSGYTLERTGSILMDYYVIMALANYRYSDTKNKKIVNFGLMCLMAGATMLTGTRLPAIAIALMVYALYIGNKIPKKIVLVLAVGGIVFMNAFQYLRTFTIPTLTDILLGNYDATTNMVRSNAGDVWYASEAIYKLIHTGVFDWAFRIKSFLGTFLNAFLPTSLTPPEALVNVYITENKLIPYTNNGGLIGVSTYLWGGYIGTAVCAVILAKLLGYAYSHQKEGWMYVSLLMLVTFPRWYSYNPRILFKFAFVGIVIIIIGKIASRLSARKI